MEKTCYTCRFYDFDGGFCSNKNSDIFGCFVPSCNVCDRWKGEDKTRYEAVRLFRKLRLSLCEYSRYFEVAIKALEKMIHEDHRLEDSLDELISRMRMRADECGDQPNMIDLGYSQAIMHLEEEIINIKKKESV